MNSFLYKTSANIWEKNIQETVKTVVDEGSQFMVPYREQLDNCWENETNPVAYDTALRIKSIIYFNPLNIRVKSLQHIYF